MSAIVSGSRRVGRHVAWRVERATTAALDRLRRGDRTVIATPVAGLRFGNWLYLWLDAHRRSAAGASTVVREAPGMGPWLERFPELQALTVRADGLRFHDRREWGEHSWNQRFGEQFSRDQLRAFIDDTLARTLDRSASECVVVNVRRGDYYAPGFRERYGFDVEGYLGEALTRIGPVDEVLVVSDDPDWCRANLARVMGAAGVRASYMAQDPIANFVAIATHRRLIGTNSTFSYWGGYVADALHPDAQIVMPRFHARTPGDFDAHQLDPGWVAIDGFH